MDLWRSVPTEVQHNFLKAISPSNIPTQQQNLSREITSFEFDVQDSDYLYLLAESFRHALLTQVEGFAIHGMRDKTHMIPRCYRLSEPAKEGPLSKKCDILNAIALF